MAQSIQELIGVPATTGSAAGNFPSAETANNEGVDGEEKSRDTILKAATGATAVGYYMSTALHVCAYIIGAIVFAYIGQILQEDEVVTPLRASLDDFDRDAEQPSFDVVQEISVSRSESQSAIERMSNNLKVVENGLIETLDNDLTPSMLQSNDDGDSGASGFLFNLPKSGLAVTKGSFTVWTEPEQPQVRQPYMIIIEVMLKNDTKVYRVNDLSGYVVGSDDYRQKIPFDSAAPSASFFTDENNQLRRISGAETIKVRRNKVQLAIRVPGAARLVKDTIQIRSRRLRERQELELVFGK